MSLLNNKKAFQAALKDWYAHSKRPLPWRTEPSLYRTVVSELMAQQTQIKTMLPYFERWMQRFPDFDALAKAPNSDVLKHWEGLGYYSRARNLHKLAQVYIGMDPKPSTASEWQALPGIGPYTSAAISSIAQNFPAAVVDGNVVRICARLTNDTREFKNNGDAVKQFTQLAKDLLNHHHPGDHNQAMMELGATVCTKHKPLCTLCPVIQFCHGAANGAPNTLPKIQRKTAIKVEISRAWVLNDKHLLLYRNDADAKQLAGQFELPSFEQLKRADPKTSPLVIKKRGITNRRITESIHALDTDEALAKFVESTPLLNWTAIGELNQITLSGPHRKWVHELLKVTES